MKIRTLFKCLQIFVSSYSLPRPMKSPDLPATSFPERDQSAAECFCAAASSFFVEREGGSEGEATRNLSVS